ncbi:alpha/beta hydrolase family protein [Trueperella bialowiezensis]|nr:alpha/beta hydrolase [Trueperella bialowiezensis]
MHKPTDNSHMQVTAQGEAQAADRLARQLVFPSSVERYGDDDRQVIEWYGDADAARTICFLHGGKFSGNGLLAATRPAASALAQTGYRVALPQMRFEPGRPELAANDAQRLAMHPQLASAVWVGHDAGALFALNVVLASELEPASAVLLAPIIDLAREVREDPAGEHGHAAVWIGGTLEERADRYALYDPLFNYYQLGEAKFRGRELSVNIIHGTADQSVPVARSRDLRSEPFNLAVVEGANHIDVIQPGHDAWVYLLGALA